MVPTAGCLVKQQMHLILHPHSQLLFKLKKYRALLGHRLNERANSSSIGPGHKLGSTEDSPAKAAAAQSGGAPENSAEARRAQMAAAAEARMKAMQQQQQQQ